MNKKNPKGASSWIKASFGAFLDTSQHILWHQLKLIILWDQLNRKHIIYHKRNYMLLVERNYMLLVKRNYMLLVERNYMLLIESMHSLRPVFDDLKVVPVIGIWAEVWKIHIFLRMAIKKFGYGKFWWVGRSTANQQIFKDGPMSSVKNISWRHFMGGGGGRAFRLTLLSIRKYMCVYIVNIFKHLLWNHWADWSQISYGASLGCGNKSLFKWSWSRDQDGCHVHIWFNGRLHQDQEENSHVLPMTVQE